MSSNVAPVQLMNAAPPLQPSQQDDVEVMLQVFAAFGRMYESAAKIHNVCNQGKTLDAFHDKADSGKPLLQ